eukprot:TRINITY_DN7346_c0_g1_i1.p1 TRINITY_DN7346_c0_g1~~TRINITY_DN7346_c0_g1_i1.p1  ORF type:complete len:429 (+),score=142.75 TRINITY_DN7346_c0_g1_i1:33-1319(+)
MSSAQVSAPTPAGGAPAPASAGQTAPMHVDSSSATPVASSTSSFVNFVSNPDHTDPKNNANAQSHAGSHSTEHDSLDMLQKVFTGVQNMQGQLQGFYVSVMNRFVEVENRLAHMEANILALTSPNASMSMIPSTPSQSSIGYTSPYLATPNGGTPSSVHKRPSMQSPTPNKTAKTGGLIEWQPRLHHRTFFRKVIFPRTRNPKERDVNLTKHLANIFSFPPGETLAQIRTKGINTIRKCRSEQNQAARYILTLNRYEFACGGEWDETKWGADEEARRTAIASRKVEHNQKLITPLKQEDHVHLWKAAGNPDVNTRSNCHKEFSVVLLEVWHEYHLEEGMLKRLNFPTQKLEAIKKKYCDYLLTPEVDQITKPCEDWCVWNDETANDLEEEDDDDLGEDVEKPLQLLGDAHHSTPALASSSTSSTQPSV